MLSYCCLTLACVASDYDFKVEKVNAGKDLMIEKADCDKIKLPSFLKRRKSFDSLHMLQPSVEAAASEQNMGMFMTSNMDLCGSVCRRLLTDMATDSTLRDMRFLRPPLARGIQDLMRVFGTSVAEADEAAASNTGKLGNMQEHLAGAFDLDRFNATMRKKMEKMMKKKSKKMKRTKKRRNDDQTAKATAITKSPSVAAHEAGATSQPSHRDLLPEDKTRILGRVRQMALTRLREALEFVYQNPERVLQHRRRVFVEFLRLSERVALWFSKQKREQKRKQTQNHKDATAEQLGQRVTIPTDSDFYLLSTALHDTIFGTTGDCVSATAVTTTAKHSCEDPNQVSKVWQRVWNKLRCVISQTLLMCPIHALDPSHQRAVMLWIFRNEDQVWRFRGGRPGHETSQQFLRFLSRRSPPSLKPEARPQHSDNDCANSHSAFPGFIAFNAEPEELFGSSDSPRNSTQLQQQLNTHLIGYAVGEWSGTDTYEIVAAYTHQDYRSLGLAKDMYNGIFLHLPLPSLSLSVMCSHLSRSCRHLCHARKRPEDRQRKADSKTKDASESADKKKVDAAVECDEDNEGDRGMKVLFEVVHGMMDRFVGSNAFYQWLHSSGLFRHVQVRESNLHICPRSLGFP